MSYNVNNIIRINTAISPAGLGFANFAEAVYFALEAELPVGFDVDTYREYTTITELAVDFPTSTETYKAMEVWLGGIPATSKVKVWAVADADADWPTTLNKARNVMWWFWSFFDKSVYAAPATSSELAQWHNANETYYINCQTGAATTEIRNPNLTSDIATTLTAAGYRYASTFAHATNPYAGISLCKWFAAVNYSANKSTITGEFKKLSGIAAENLAGSEYGAMTQATKKCQFYSVVDLQGSTDAGRVINSWSHSSYGEYMDDVVNLAAFVNALKVTLYNTLANSVTKVGQDPIGQSLLINSAKAVCEQYVSNDYLGARNYTDPDDGVEKYTAGYEILTRPEEILNLSEPDRDARKSAPLRVRIFRKGAIHSAAVDISVY
ncbi:MAG: hypothetical protein DRQ46_10820 [Gammaproteobacteria bacterium]|nr:MAG: hypothetical protein DRQ46_10820 [Gammaproteobacteria bacterium]